MQKINVWPQWSLNKTLLLDSAPCWLIASPAPTSLFVVLGASNCPRMEDILLVNQGSQFTTWFHPHINWEKSSHLPSSGNLFHQNCQDL